MFITLLERNRFGTFKLMQSLPYVDLIRDLQELVEPERISTNSLIASAVSGETAHTVKSNNI